MSRACILLLFAGFGVGCGVELPEAPDTPWLDLAAGGNSRCATVKFNVAVTFTGANYTYAGPVTGDLVGTQTAQFLWQEEPTGVTLANGGIAHWDITGGVLGALTFDTEFTNRNIGTDRPGSPSEVFENTGSHRATGGVRTANLTYIGSFPLTTFTTDHYYNGVICP